LGAAQSSRYDSFASLGEIEADQMAPAGHPTKAFFGWRVVAAVFVLATFGWGLGFYGPPVYLHAVRETRGWSLALVSSAVTVHFLFGALVVANLQRLYQKFGISAVTKAGSAVLAAGVCGWAMAREPWELLLATLLSGGGWATMGAAAVNAIVSPWFIRSRPAALASAYNGSSVGGVVFSPLWVAAIGVLGFPGAALAIGVVTIAAMWVLADLYYAKTPNEMGLGADGDVPESVPLSIPSPFAAPLPGHRLWRNWRFISWRAGWLLGCSRRSAFWPICSRCSCRRSASKSPALRREPLPHPRSPGELSSGG
jgi:MFS family permease